jgi:hypothetical protein
VDTLGPTTKAWESRQESRGAWERGASKLRALVRERAAGTLCREKLGFEGTNGGAVADIDARRTGAGGMLPEARELRSRDWRGVSVRHQFCSSARLVKLLATD